jgi:molybdenum cofactor synthesis domain-containing protein
MEHSMPKTAGIIIIGNEILTGKVSDCNSSYLASELRTLGVSLMRISVIPDDAEVIGNEAAAFSKAYDYVFTSGGVGPTHDDVTMEGIAKGFRGRIIPHPELVRRFQAHYGGRCNAAVMKMAEVPEGAEIIDPGDMSFPVVSFRNIFIFPGIPKYLAEKFSAIKERFRCAAFHLKRLFLNANESDVAEILNRTVSVHGDVTFGSYPILDNPEYKVIVTAESKSPDALGRSVAELMERLPGGAVVRVE